MESHCVLSDDAFKDIDTEKIFDLASLRPKALLSLRIKIGVCQFPEISFLTQGEQA